MRRHRRIGIAERRVLRCVDRRRRVATTTTEGPAPREPERRPRRPTRAPRHTEAETEATEAVTGHRRPAATEADDRRHRGTPLDGRRRRRRSTSPSTARAPRSGRRRSPPPRRPRSPPTTASSRSSSACPTSRATRRHVPRRRRGRPGRGPVHQREARRHRRRPRGRHARAPDRARVLRAPRRPERGAGVRQRGRRRQPEHGDDRRRLLHAADVPTLRRLPGHRDVADLHRRLRPARRGLAVRRLPDGLPVERRDDRRDQGARPAGGDLGRRTHPATECWQDTQERFYQYYADTLENFEFQGFPYDARRDRRQAGRGPAGRRLPRRSRERGRVLRHPGVRLRATTSRAWPAPASTPRSTSPTRAPATRSRACPRATG